MSSSESKLFQPVRVGPLQLQHRIVLCPMTRLKSTQWTHIPHKDMVKEYYSQRASTPGTLLISEATAVLPEAGGQDHIPGIWSDEQIAAWKEVTDAVHSKDCFIISQLWSLGRAADPKELRAENPAFEYVGPSAIRQSDQEETPRELTKEEIEALVKGYANAASNAMQKAGFDGVEILGGGGYLIDQFIQEVSNQRTDEYGGSIENRVRFALEVIDAVVQVVGAERTGFRFSPWIYGLRDMGMKDPKATYTYLVSQIKERYPNFGWLHVVEPRVNALEVRETIPEGFSNDFLREIWAPLPFIAAGGFDIDSAKAHADTKGDIVAFGRKFLANPDLPLRLKKGIPLNDYDRSTFYVGGTDTRGYTDYPFAQN
ncbi:FMN-linked oxidoreductase [Cylindrobasidium torrendii FP15055 ss-10]|uniref:FMN-linked oxidoreductase n=1 Tax=Cylindrobasidium torrendii FP15055 ss-10 TaxID=1314674 RepID=A0A0D7B0F7_9AGAR|nr:FMN-linked oxidoreductase [Cylindrobasidium torrendii FP15055 ss-10]